MIQINLLSHSGSKGRVQKPGAAAAASSGGLGIVWAALFVALLFDGAAGYLAFQRVTAARSRWATLQSDYDLVKKQIDEKMSGAENIRKFREVIDNQMDVLKLLDPPDRIMWCEKINMLSNLIPADVFLSEVEVREYSNMVETAASKAAREKFKKSLQIPQKNEKGPKPKEPPAIRKPVIYYEMRLTGVALGEDKDQQLKNVLKFQSALTQYEMAGDKGEPRRFMDGFLPGIGFESVQAIEFEGTPVNQFTFKLTTKSMGGDTPPPTTPARQVAAHAGTERAPVR